jgi:hypothetical protein
MVLHPSGLKGCVLTVVCEHEEPFPFCVLEHVLSEHVYVRNRHRTNGARRLPVPAKRHPAAGAATQTGAEPTIAFLPRLGRVDPRQHIRPATTFAVRLLMTVQAPAHPAEPNSFGSVRLIVVPVLLGDEAVNKNCALSSIG